MREELVSRNVARLVELPSWERQPITPWTAAEARAFLDAAKDDPLYPAFVLLLLYGLRRGEVLGLRWHDVDEAGQRGPGPPAHPARPGRAAASARSRPPRAAVTCPLLGLAAELL